VFAQNIIRGKKTPMKEEPVIIHQVKREFWRYYIFGIATQIIALVMLGVGIGIEIVYRAEIGIILITVGSTIFAVATKIKSKGVA
jgi:hypothetical protein